MQTNYKGTVFFDLDGTLLNAHSKIDADVAQATRELKENGYLPVVNTGRAPIEIDPVLDSTDIDTYITLDGAYVQSQGKVVYENNIKPDLIEKLLKQAGKFGDTVSVHSADQSYLNAVNPFVEGFYKSVHLELPEIDPDFYKSNKIPMIVIVTEGDGSNYQKVFDDLTFYKTGPRSVDVVNKGVSKMSGIKHLLKELDLEDKPTYAFGDGNNDLPMLEFADYSVAMGNGLDSVKAIASYVTTENVNGGIVNGLKHYNLI
ncbi:haloacid dehalogenase family hydrolase [Companilactobacillus paralimentarius DSM 13238 = JCM 10415]|uniref:Haloacid dehalogenase family hydrolase n=1 Tax=Companilactobacillus paralimentarius DSM 13238 = JCM 10415 TaxID=1122151 RepID=A0A0R1PL61_9LACO|nr:Cof-type HAD-IIB family hydrolase [Companilactobacillus paralimentarius]KAE9565346.1 haloacid dehalogenase [Companilactobacillus paralimentarius]KRL30741.1 haloacid dehalogenase family hydrolase [Companilactobacillus paralimentarius DSM 13238 = JCM 10415]MDR4933536.1 Cof-type HAD-IIB family hydrolase [Companilactobacillus paralimentarius]QFR70011.1 Cof-type HAD-IIB family hydrolase [Companilactobacillus paralimentarius]